jgi:hypothetical protein|tara:strand:+ start:594 stop:779 length:186 start_codon:yes stop_codon:yes gene_type:complete
MIKKDFDFVMKVLSNRDNKPIHTKALKNLINNFENKWNDMLGPGVADFYVEILTKKYQSDI